jgi:uncharacterized membrane protein YphA (DoxX/SURF4 family)
VHVYFILLARLALGSVWITAAASKLLAERHHGNAVADFDLLPRPAAIAVGTVLLAIELLLGGLLIVGQWTTRAAEASVGLLLVFTAAIVLSLARGNPVRCNCFGHWGEETISIYTAARNAGLLAVAIFVASRRSPYLSADGWWSGTALVPGDPPAWDFLPVVLIAIATMLIGLMGRAAYSATKGAWRRPPVNEAGS